MAAPCKTVIHSSKIHHSFYGGYYGINGVNTKKKKKKCNIPSLKKNAICYFTYLNIIYTMNPHFTTAFITKILQLL